MITFFLASIVLLSCNKQKDQLFENPSHTATGVDFTNILVPNDNLNILDYLYFYNGGGVAIGDINGDELPDIFFSANQGKNKLYINKGDLKFEDISSTAGIEGNSSWNTGAVMGDINGDGLLDIYVCAVVGLNGFDGYNELYINNGDGTFTENAAKYGLDFDSYSSSAAFLDYDLDGDLDIYLLNHAIHTQESYGHADTRRKRSYETGDKLLRNDGQKFVDVSEEAGIFSGVNSYGLGVAISDFNQDGFPDIFVGNDFHEDDYYYLNNGDGTFKESLKTYFGHTSRFSMGNDVGDINHDGWPDIISLDMLPEDEKVLKSSEGSDNVQTQKMRTERFGYHYQFARNMLFVNNQGSSYSETALLSGIAATDWSWSALFSDYDQDGEQDIFISNGIPKRPNDLDYINFVSNEQIQTKITNTKLVDQQALNLMPSGAVQNAIFKGKKDLLFENKSGQWISNDTIISGATAMGDLDLDGDLDLVTNNSNQYASLYINQTNDKSNYLKLKFNYSKENRHGIGTKVFSYSNGRLTYKELYTVRGFQASSEPIIHFGYGQADQVDSLKIIWPDNSYQVLRNVPTNQFLTVSPENTTAFDYSTLKLKTTPVFEKVDGNLGIDFTHKEDSYIDFNRQKLIPYQISDRGPATAIGDMDSDGKPDIFFGGSKFIPSAVFVQKDTAYSRKDFPTISKDSIKEDVAAHIADFNLDGENDLFIGTGGADFYNQMEPLLNSFYLKEEGAFKSVDVYESFSNVSVVAPFDMDDDGDLDLFVGNQAISNDFGNIPESYILRNNEGRFEKDLENPIDNLGMVTDAIWSDFDNDGLKDLIVVGEWMSPTFFKNLNGRLTKTSVGIENLTGLWQTIIPFDIDRDGDNDYIMGNWGTNSKFKASKNAPLKLYYGDLDKNGQTETIVAIEKNGNYYPLEDFDQLSGQIIILKKKYPDYKSFAGETIDDIFKRSELKSSSILEVSELSSGFLRNDNGKFSFVAFDNSLQVSPITALLSYDFDSDGHQEVLVGGNYFGVKPFQGRFDSFSGALIKNENSVILGHRIGLDFTQKSIRDLSIISLKDEKYLLVTINNDQIQVYKLKK